MRQVALLVGALLITAGCLGFGGSDADPDPQADAGVSSPSTDRPASNASGTANGSAVEDHDHEPEPEKHWLNLTGEVGGVRVVVATGETVANETIELPEDPTSLALTVTAEGGELDVDVLPPGCTDEPDLLGVVNTQSPSCATSGSTANDTTEELAPDGGTFSFSTENPEAGNWTVQVTKADQGANAVSYAIQAVYVDIHEPGADHEHG